ncbi:Uncharacterized protein QTN25_003615 [Entamoeba marina]
MDPSLSLNDELQEELNRYKKEEKEKYKSKEPTDFELKSKKLEKDGLDDLDDLIDFEGEERNDNSSDVEMEPFNLDRERDEGEFDVDCNYTLHRRNKEKDAWADELEESKKIVTTKVPNRLEEDYDSKYENVEMNKNTYLKRISEMLLDGEVPSKAICRLKKEQKKNELDILMDLCGSLVDIGDFLIYERKKEDIVAQIQN